MNKDDEIAKFVANLIDATVFFAQHKGYGKQFVVRALFSAAGTFGRTTDKADFFAAINQFIKSTRMLYPDFTFEGDPYLGMYKQILEQKALEEKQTQTVH